MTHTFEIDGDIYTLEELAKAYNVSIAQIKMRLTDPTRKNWTLKKCVETPIIHYNRRLRMFIGNKPICLP